MPDQKKQTQKASIKSEHYYHFGSGKMSEMYWIAYVCLGVYFLTESIFILWNHRSRHNLKEHITQIIL